MTDNIEYQESSGNVFEDLGFADSKEMLIKAELAFKINSLLKHRGLKQNEAAKLLKTSQAKISLLNHGHLKGFSLEKLMNYLVRLDRDIKIIVKPKPRSHPIATISVDAA
jgi:predicted XRE-type DNA-binding protein